MGSFSILLVMLLALAGAGASERGGLRRDRSTLNADVEAKQRNALVALYQATNGPYWSNSNNGWGGRDPCSWLGVYCDASFSQIV